MGKISRAQLEDSAKAKQADLTAADMDAAVRAIAGSARSMGLVVEGSDMPMTKRQNSILAATQPGKAY